MPQNAIIRANGTGDYTTIIAWEAAEQSSDYGAITVGRVDGFFDAGASQTIISGTWTNGARLEPFDSADAFDGTERSLCGMTSTASITLRNTGKKVEFEGLEVYNTGTGRAYSNTTAGGDLSFLLGLARSDTGDTTNNNTNVGVGFVDSVVVSENGNPHRDGNFDKCSIFGNASSALGMGATNNTDNTVTVNADTGLCYRASVTQSNNASTDASADTLDNIVVATEFVDATPVASGDYRIKAGSDLDTNGIGAFIVSGGISVTGQTANYNYTGITGTVDLTGEVIVTGATANYDYIGITGTIEIGAEIVVIGATANYDYAGIVGSVELTGLITVTGQTANYDYDGIAADIILQGSIIITGSTANYDYNALNGTIIIQGPITINPKNIIRVKRQSNTIRVKRSSNTIIVR